MTTRTWYVITCAAAIGALCACGGTGAVSHVPALAEAAAVQTGAALTPNAATTVVTKCGLALRPCAAGMNSSRGAGLAGISADGRGVFGQTNHGSTSPDDAMYGVYGIDASKSVYNAGVFGISSQGYGVVGKSKNSIGISAYSGSSIAVYANSVNNDAVYGVGSAYGIIGFGSGYYGLYGSGGQGGVYGSSTDGYGVRAKVTGGGAAFYGETNGRGLELHTSGSSSGAIGAFVTNGSGNGGDFSGSYIGLVGRASAFPLVATDPQGNNLFYVDGSGNVHYHGTLSQFSAVREGGSAVAYAPSATRPSIEDTGTAHLSGGRATVTLDPTFARAIDNHRPYQVFLTPGGDTRGLYVQRKGPSSFVVREVQGGTGTFDFDYHVYATQIGAGGRHMMLVQPNARPIQFRAPAAVTRPAPPPGH